MRREGNGLYARKLHRRLPRGAEGQCRAGRAREGARAAGAAAGQPGVRRLGGRAGGADRHAQAARGCRPGLRRAGALQPARPSLAAA
ncbi:hypothetical protein FHP25_34100 [Vineibacter terrae]|uniref:Uncharacterized protein n=1 Tax=Vineibacter terrae TaxID=2586908 RepID=A0A5C8PA59_9HYPH|nr:hypothetical protein FHP25_34100 [Vineibacter terrae]